MKRSTISLIAAKTLISYPEDWTIGDNATDALGFPLCGDEVGAVCWCSVGALQAVDAPAKAYDFLFEAAITLGFCSAIKLNDTSNHSTVMTMFDIAIENSEA